MQGYFARLGLCVAGLVLASCVMTDTAGAAISNAGKCGIKPKTPAPAPVTVTAPVTAPTYTDTNPCCKQWDCAKLKCAVSEIKVKTDCLLRAIACARVRNRCLYDQVVNLNTELCKLLRCECLSDCEIETIISCVERKVCEIERTVQSTCNRDWICKVSEIKCAVQKLGECKKACPPPPCQPTEEPAPGSTAPTCQPTPVCEPAPVCIGSRRI